MNLRDHEIEHTLRRAPRPAPPVGLRAKLLAQLELPSAEFEAGPDLRGPTQVGRLRRWWPGLLPATLSLACGVVLWVQQTEIRQLKESIRVLSTSTNTVEMMPATTPVETADPAAQIEDPTVRERLEITRLTQLAGQLSAELAQLQRLEKENESLRGQLSAASGPTQEELDALARAKEKAVSIQCINNLKQFGLAVRIWAMDNQGVNPPDPLSMSNELSTPKILVCPADTNRVVANIWSAYTPDNCSYEYLAPSVTNADHEPSRVSVRCPIHGHVGLCDGSVMNAVTKEHPDWFVKKDGKLYLDRKPSTPKR